MRGRKKRTLILGILCCLLVFMGVGFAVARTTLNIGGTSTAINTWDVRIANISVSSKSEGVTNSEEETKIGDDGVSANLQADFIKPGDYITYEVLVENNGSIDATLNELEVDISTDNEADKDLFKVENTLPENKKLSAGESITFTITITFNKDAEKLPSGEVRFNVGLNYYQGEGIEGGGNLPGGNEPEKDWDFEVDESGTITAYNYDLGTDVVVPATNYEGKEIKTITEQSFIPQGNIDLYLDESAMKFYGIIREDNTIIVDTVNNRTAAEVVVDKTLYLLSYEECQGDSSCIAQYKSISYICKDKDACYNYTDEAKTIVSISETAETMGSIYINPDPNVSPEESIAELKSNVKTLDLSKATNLTTVGDSAFSSAGLESVDFGENSNITSIGNSAFSNNSLTSVEIPASVEMIGGSAFSGNQIETLTLGTAIEAQNQLTKNNKYSLTKLTAGVQKTSASNSKLRIIDSYAFSNNKIQSLVLPSSLERIGSYAFQSNQISGELVLPSILTTIESNAFSNNKISILTFPKTVTSLGSLAFSSNPIQILTIEECNTTICSGYSSGNNYFGNNIKSLTIESGVIGNYAFSSSTDSTTKLESLTLGEGVTSIGSYAFENNNISTLTVPKTVTSVGNSAFENNPLEILTIEECNTTICSGFSSFGNKYFGNQIKSLIIESGEVGEAGFKSQSDSTTKIENLTLGEGVTTIGDSAFTNNAITELTLPSTLTSIGSEAFLSNLINQKLYLPKNIKTIGNQAFENNQIPQLEVSEECDSIELGYRVFKDNQIRGVFNTSDNFASIGKEAFSSNQLDEVYIDENVIQVGNFAFEKQARLQRLTIENCSGELSSTGWGGIAEMVEIKRGEIGDLTFVAFYGNIETLILGEGVTSIGISAFNNNKIKHLVIPASVISIGNNAFGIQHDSSGNPVLESITIKRTETDFQANVTVGTNWYDNRLNPIITYALS